MTHDEMKSRIDDFGGPDKITDQERLRICIEHWEGMKNTSGKTAIKDMISWRSCALCDKYYSEDLLGDCDKAGEMCLLGNHGCMSYYNGAVYCSDVGEGFGKAADEMIAFLESFLEDEVMVIEYEDENTIRLKQPSERYKTPYGVIRSDMNDKTDRELLAETLRRFNAYGEIVAKLKERKRYLDKEGRGKNHDEYLFIVNSLAIAEPTPKPEPIQVGDMVRADEVPIGATVDVGEERGQRIKVVRVNGSADDEKSLCFDCVCCGHRGGRYIKLGIACKILTLPDKK